MATDHDADDDDDVDDDGDHDDDDEDAHVDVDGDELATLCSLDPLSRRLVWAAATDGKTCSRGHLPTVCGACWARHTMLLRLDLAALGFPFTAFPPHLVGVILLFCGLKLRVFAHGLGVLPV